MAEAHQSASVPAIVRTGEPARDFEAILEAISGGALHLYVARQAGVRLLTEGSAVSIGYEAYEAFVWIDGRAMDLRPVDVGARFPAGYRFIVPIPDAVRTSQMRRYPRVRAAYPVRFIEVETYPTASRPSYREMRAELAESGTLARGTWLGGGGFAMVSARPHAVGDRLFVEVDTPGLIFDVEAEVVWSQPVDGPGGGQARRVGLTFVGVSPFLREAIIAALPAAASVPS